MSENAPARIGKTIVIKGEVKGSEDLMLDGHVEGTVTLADNRLTVGPTATIAADLTAKDVLIMGRVQGNVVATGRVELRAGCNLEGDIRASRLAIEDNAVFFGKVISRRAQPKCLLENLRNAGLDPVPRIDIGWSMIAGLRPMSRRGREGYSPCCVVSSTKSRRPDRPLNRQA
jgi:cytoskeletal protein CcmA (bactofilin family)